VNSFKKHCNGREKPEAALVRRVLKSAGERPVVVFPNGFESEVDIEKALPYLSDVHEEEEKIKETWRARTEGGR